MVEGWRVPEAGVKVKSERAVNIGLLVLALTGLVVGSILADVFKVLIAVVIAYGVLRLGLAMLRNLARTAAGAAGPGHPAQGQDRVPLRHLRGRSTHDHRPRRGPRAAPPLPGRDGPGDTHRVTATGVIHRLWTNRGIITTV